MDSHHLKIALQQLSHGVDEICKAELTKKAKGELRDMAIKLYSVSGGVSHTLADNAETLLQYTSEAICELVKTDKLKLNKAAMRLDGKDVTTPELVKHMAMQLNDLAFHLGIHNKSMRTDD